MVQHQANRPVATNPPRVTKVPERTELPHYLLRLVTERLVRRGAVAGEYGTTWRVLIEDRRSVPDHLPWALEALTRWGLICWHQYRADSPIAEMAYPTKSGLAVLAAWDDELFSADDEQGQAGSTGGASS